MGMSMMRGKRNDDDDGGGPPGGGGGGGVQWKAKALAPQYLGGGTWAFPVGPATKAPPPPPTLSQKISNFARAAIPSFSWSSFLSNRNK